MRYTQIILLLLLICISCRKSPFLNEIPNKSLVIPETIEDFQALLDNDNIMNGSSLSSYMGLNPAFGEASSDDYYIYNESEFNTLSDGYKNVYTWNDNLPSERIGEFREWELPYRAVLYANTVLDGLVKLNITDNQLFAYNKARGSALFYRSEMFFQLVNIFALPYDKVTAVNDLGIVLRMTSDINEKIFRSSVQQTYDRIIADLMIAKDILPNNTDNKNQPSQIAALALLSRVYLSMSKYDSAFKYASASLELNGRLLDYNILNSDATFPIPRYNEEIVFHSCLNTNVSFLFRGLGRIDTLLLKSYQAGDLRVAVYFNNETVGKSFKGSYDGSSAAWGGIANDELYLTRAECYARKGDIVNAMKDLNALLSKRWKTEVFVPVSAINNTDALDKILLERRKELLYRGLRWIDIRRLNKEGANIILKRKISGQEYTLLPNSLRYAFLIPSYVMNINPGMPQNNR